MRAQFRVRISPADIGRRVTVRYRIDAARGQPHYSDAVGVLRSWRAGSLHIENRRGELLTVDEERLVAGRVVPEAPRRNQ